MNLLLVLKFIDFSNPFHMTFILKSNLPSSCILRNPPIHIYINRSDNRLLFKIKDGHKPELQTPEAMRKFPRKCTKS